MKNYILLCSRVFPVQKQSIFILGLESLRYHLGLWEKTRYLTLSGTPSTTILFVIHHCYPKIVVIHHRSLKNLLSFIIVAWKMLSFIIVAWKICCLSIEYWNLYVVLQKNTISLKNINAIVILYKCHCHLHLVQKSC